MFSNWVSTYEADNEKVMENKGEFKREQVPEWFRNRYHTYHRTKYDTDFSKAIGIHGDNPNDKFNKTQVPGKLYRDNLDVEIGTTKNFDSIPGYAGKTS
jgi:hypothetical protein